MENILNFYNNMEGLAKQGVHIDWRKVAADMATGISEQIKLQEKPPEPPQA